MANKSYCKITGKYYTDATVKANLSKAYKEFYMFEPLGCCEGCGLTAQGTAHIVPKSVLKLLGLTSLIWNSEVWFRACHRCNQIAENVSSEEITKLKNFERIKKVIQKYDKERYEKISIHRTI